MRNEPIPKKKVETQVIATLEFAGPMPADALLRKVDRTGGYTSHSLLMPMVRDGRLVRSLQEDNQFHYGLPKHVKNEGGAA